MKVFLSSVRVGLEQERDCLPGLLKAVGHEPVRFEDFGALPVPSREACLRGVAESDVYLLLLGPLYGHVFPETGQSATHDEWTAAQAKGLPRLVFRKAGVDLEPEQAAFAEQIGEYGTGVFYRTFKNAVDLQPKVVESLRTLAAAPSPLTFEPLSAPAGIEWAMPAKAGTPGKDDARLVVHVRPLVGTRLTSRLLRELPDRLIAAVRRAGIVDQSVGLVPQSGDNSVGISWPSKSSRRGFGAVYPSEPVGIRMNADCQVSVSWTLPGDGLGVILSEDDLAAGIRTSLRAVGLMDLIRSSRLVVAAELGNLGMVSEGLITGTARTAASFSFSTNQRTLRVEPDESVSDAALGLGAEEVSRLVAGSLVAYYRKKGQGQ